MSDTQWPRGRHLGAQWALYALVVFVLLSAVDLGAKELFSVDWLSFWIGRAATLVVAAATVYTYYRFGEPSEPYRKPVQYVHTAESETPRAQCRYPTCEAAALADGDGAAYGYCKLHWSLASLPEQAVFRETAARHLLAIQEFWGRINIHMVIQIGLVSALVVLAELRAKNAGNASDDTTSSTLIAVIGMAGIVVSYTGALIATRSLHLMRGWQAATFRAETAIGQNGYQTESTTIHTGPQGKEGIWTRDDSLPEDMLVYRLSSATLATTLPWTFAVAWPLLVLLLVHP